MNHSRAHNAHIHDRCTIHTIRRRDALSTHRCAALTQYIHFVVRRLDRLLPSSLYTTYDRAPMRCASPSIVRSHLLPDSIAQVD